MGLWKFYDFLDASGANTIRPWLDSLPAKAQAKINTRLLFMEAKAVWPEPWVSALKGWPHLMELRIGNFGVAYRPIGFHGPEKREFTITLGAIEKGKLPKRVLEVADANRKIVIATSRRRICEHEFDRGADVGESEQQSKL